MLLLDTEINRQREEGEGENPKQAPFTKFKVGLNWDPARVARDSHAGRGTVRSLFAATCNALPYLEFGCEAHFVLLTQDLCMIGI